MADDNKLVVELDDGTQETFNGLEEGKPRAQRMKKAVEAGENGIQARLAFRNGAVREFFLPDSLVEQCAIHGLSQKLGDEIAGITDTDDCLAAIDDLLIRLNKGEWTVKRKKGTGAGASMLITALTEVTGKSIETVKEFLAGKTTEEKAALRNSERVRPIFLRLQNEKARKKAEKAGIDTDSMLDELE